MPPEPAEHLGAPHPHRLLSIHNLGKLTDGFRRIVGEELESLPSEKSLHGIIEHLVQMGMNERMGVDTIARFIASDKTVKKVLGARVNEVFRRFFPPPDVTPESISKEAIAWGIQLIVRYFLEHFQSGSLHEYLRQAEPLFPEGLRAELGALFSSESFRDTVVRGFANFAKVIVHDTFTEKMKDEATRSAYFGDFVATLCAEDHSTRERGEQDDRWEHLFRDALDHGVSKEFIFDLIRKQNAVPELQGAVRAGVAALTPPSEAAFPPNPFTSLWQKAFHKRAAARKKAHEFLTSTLAEFFEVDEEQLFEVVDPFLLLSMVTDPAHHREDIERYCSKYFSHLDAQKLNEHFYWKKEPTPENPYMVSYG